MIAIDNIPQFEYGFYSDALQECYQKFGTIFDFPIIDNHTREMRRHYVVGNVLDIGAGKAKPLYKTFKKRLKDGNYYSLDTDPQGAFDFHDIDEIPSNLIFMLITANQVFEHLDIAESIELMWKASQHLEAGGKIIATVPNTDHPTRQLSNITHKTPWGAHNFYMVFKYANLEVTKIARYSKRHPQGFMEKLVTKYVSRVYRIDWCDSILMIGEKSKPC
jgi:hypothetical protein